MLIEVDESLYALQFRSRKTAAFLQPDRVNPKLGDMVLALDMHMRWFIAITCVKEEAIGPCSEYSRHASLSMQSGNISTLSG